MKNLRVTHNPSTHTFTALVPGGEAKIDYIPTWRSLY